MDGENPHVAPHAADAASASSSAPASPSTASAAADAIAFRLLLPRALGGHDDFHLYAAVAPLRDRTAGLEFRVDDIEGYPEGSASRVALVVGPTSPIRRVQASSSSGEPLDLSPVQEALVALVDVGGVLHRDIDRGPEFLACRVLVEAARLGAQGMGTLRAIASETGADILASMVEQARPPSLHSSDVLLQITGDIITIKKAIVALSSWLPGDLHAGSSNGAGIMIMDETDALACASHCERVLQQPAGTSPAENKLLSCLPVLPPHILQIIIGRLPPNVPIPSSEWHRMTQSVPRPTLLVPRHADDDWQMLLPAWFALSGHTLTTSTLDGGQKLTHITVPGPYCWIMFDDDLLLNKISVGQKCELKK